MQNTANERKSRPDRQKKLSFSKLKKTAEGSFFEQ
jgi:hypothetical protein